LAGGEGVVTLVLPPVDPKPLEKPETDGIKAGLIKAGYAPNQATAISIAMGLAGKKKHAAGQPIPKPKRRARVIAKVSR
jgi:hypothetical protein